MSRESSSRANRLAKRKRHGLSPDADPGTLERELADPSLVLDDRIAQLIRDKAASLVVTDPSLAYRLSTALLESSRRASVRSDPRTRAIVWRCRAEAAAYTGRTADARDAYERASSEAQASGDEGLLGQILVGRMGLLALVGASSESAKLARKAERLLRKTGDLAYLGKLYMNLGNAHYHEERHKEAYEAYGRAARSFEKMGQRDPTWIGLLINQAIACTQLSRIGEARRLFLRTESICREEGFEHFEAQAKFNRAFLEQLRGDFRDALFLLETSGKIFEAHGDGVMVASTERARSEIYLELGMWREALDSSRAAAEVFSREGMALDEMLSRIAESRALVGLHRPEEAVAILDSVRTFYEARHNRPSRASVLLQLSDASLEGGDATAAKSFAGDALRTFESLGMHGSSAAARRSLASAFLAEGKPRDAERVLGVTLEMPRRVSIGERLHLWALSGKISMARGRPSEAKERLRRAVECVERQRRLIPGVEFRARAFEHHVSVYHDLIGVLLGSGKPRLGTLHSLVQSARARGFRERLGSKRGHLPAEVREKRARLGSAVRRLEEAQFSEGEDPARLEKLSAEVQRLEREVEKQIQSVEAGEKGGRPWNVARRPRDISPGLVAGECVIEYFVSGDRILAFVFGADFQTMRQLPEATGSLQEDIESIRFQLETMALTADRLAGSRAFLLSSAENVLGNLHGKLIGPLRDLIPPSGRLTIIPHGFLHQVPFECLTDGHGYIGDIWQVSRVPTVDYLSAGRRRRTPKKVLVVAMVGGGPAFVESEAKAVAGAFPPERVLTLRDPTVEEVLEELPSSDIVHITTHAMFRDDNPAFSRLSLKGGALFLADILETRLKAQLVVLSACNTGLVFAGRGDDLSGVAHGFLAAGARQLMASLWRVHDEATEDLMAAFYGQYAGESGRDPVLALSRARQEIRERRNHPFYWGGFSIHGR